MARKFEANEGHFAPMSLFAQARDALGNFFGQPRGVEQSLARKPVVKGSPDLAPPSDQRADFLASCRIYCKSQALLEALIEQMNQIDVRGQWFRRGRFIQSSLSKIAILKKRMRPAAPRATAPSKSSPSIGSGCRSSEYPTRIFPLRFVLIEIAAVSGGQTSRSRPKPYSRLQEERAACSGGPDWSF